jgi:hypothetical protein
MAIGITAAMNHRTWRRSRPIVPTVRGSSRSKPCRHLIWMTRQKRVDPQPEARLEVPDDPQRVIRAP